MDLSVCTGIDIDLSVVQLLILTYCGTGIDNDLPEHTSIDINLTCSCGY